MRIWTWNPCSITCVLLSHFLVVTLHIGLAWVYVEQELVANFHRDRSRELALTWGHSGMFHRQVGSLPRACPAGGGTHDFCWSLFQSFTFMKEKQLFMLWCMTHCLVILIVFGCT